MKILKVLITAGATEVPIDDVRALTNIFGGRTGAAIAMYFHRKGCNVTLLTRSPHLVPLCVGDCTGPRVIPFKTFDELHRLMRREIRTGNYDAIIHSAAVSDYRVTGAFVVRRGKLRRISSRGKISGSHPEIYLRLEPTMKLIDQIRKPWGFKGTVVKFKLQSKISDRKLLAIARRSRVASNADLIVANCLAWCRKRAYIVDRDGNAVSVKRDNLPRELYRRIAQ